MKKSVFGSALIIAGLTCFAARADKTGDTEAIIKVLSAAYGADVTVKLDAQTCEITYPQVDIEDETVVYIEPKTPDEEPRTETKKLITTIPATTVQCSATDDFDKYKQYRFAHNSSDKFIAQLYNTFGFAFVKDFEIKNFNEEIQIVPELGLVSLRKLHLGDAVYVQKDETTGLKSEIGNLKNYEFLQKITQNGNIFRQQVDMNLDTFNLMLPLFSLQINSEQSASEFVYDIPAEGRFDYENLTQNIAYLLSAKSSAIGKDIKVDVFGMGGRFDLDIKNNSQRNDDDSVRMISTMLLKNIVFNGDLIDKEKQPKSVSLMYSLKDVPAESLVELAAIQQDKGERMEKAQTPEEMQAAEDAISERLAELLDKLAPKAKLIAQIDFEFTDAQIAAEFSIGSKDGYLDGIGKIKVANLYKIFPNQEQCLKNLKTDNSSECEGDFLLSGIENYIDVTKNNSETVYKYTEQGIFKNNEKIGDPVELNFKKMYLEKKQKDKEREEMLRQMTEQQSAAEIE